MASYRYLPDQRIECFLAYAKFAEKITVFLPLRIFNFLVRILKDIKNFGNENMKKMSSKEVYFTTQVEIFSTAKPAEISYSGT